MTDADGKVTFDLFEDIPVENVDAIDVLVTS